MKQERASSWNFLNLRRILLEFGSAIAHLRTYQRATKRNQTLLLLRSRSFHGCRPRDILLFWRWHVVWEISVSNQYVVFNTNLQRELLCNCLSRFCGYLYIYKEVSWTQIKSVQHTMKHKNLRYGGISWRLWATPGAGVNLGTRIFAPSSIKW